MSAPLDMAAVRAELERRAHALGLRPRSGWAALAQLCLFVSVGAGALAVVLVATSPLVRLLAAPLAAGGWSFAALVGHDAAHGAASRSRLMNRLLGTLAFGVVGGVSVRMWKAKHGLHHAFANDAERDPDVQHRPFVHSQAQHRTSPPALRWFQQRQRWAFWLVAAPLSGVEIRARSLLFAVSALREKRALDRWGDLASLLLHVGLVYGLPLALVGLGPTLNAHVLVTPLVGWLLTAVLAPAHMPMPLVRGTSDPLTSTLLTTCTFAPSRAMSFLLSGMNCQIEHHLWPGRSHFDLPKLAPVVRELCREHQLPYAQVTWWQGLRQVHQHLGDAPHLPELNWSGAQVR